MLLTGRRYLDDRACYGTADVMDPERVRIWDYKFTAHDGLQTERYRAQLEALALFAAGDTASEASCTIVWIRPDGSHRPQSWSLGAADLQLVHQRLMETLAGVVDARQALAAGGTPDVARGTWCKWCPAYASCPATAALLSAAAGDVTGPVTAATATAAYRKARDLEAALHQTKAALYAYSHCRPIELGGGLRYGPRTVVRERLDASKARPLLVAALGAHAEAAWSYEASKASVQRAWRVAKADGATDATLTALLDALRAAGALEEEPSERMEEYQTEAAQSAA
jgi:hypothetical protein